jgi:hypothetical protein
MSRPVTSCRCHATRSPPDIRRSHDGMECLCSQRCGPGIRYRQQEVGEHSPYTPGHGTRQSLAVASHLRYRHQAPYIQQPTQVMPIACRGRIAIRHHLTERRTPPEPIADTTRADHSQYLRDGRTILMHRRAGWYPASDTAYMNDARSLSRRQTPRERTAGSTSADRSHDVFAIVHLV